MVEQSKIEEKMMRLQQFQQQLQTLNVQKQQIQLEQAEIKNALKELSKVEDEKTYELVGKILINKEPSKLKESLTEKQERIELRIESIDKQLKRVTSKAQSLQKEVMSLRQEQPK